MNTSINDRMIKAAKNQGREMASRLDMPAGRLLWKLARFLKGIPDVDDIEVMTLKPAFDAFAEAVVKHGDGSSEFEATDRDDLWEEFAYCWQVVKFPEGSGFLKGALDRAKKDPIEVDPPISPNFVLLVGTAHYLQLSRGQEPFMLPVRLVGLLFGRDKMYATRLIGLMLKHGFIVEVGEAKWRQGLARDFRFRFERLNRGAATANGR